MQVFVMIDGVRIKINADMNVKNWLIKVGVMMNLFGILACVNENKINNAILVNTWITWIVNVERSWLIKWLKNVMKILMKMNNIWSYADPVSGI